MKNFFNHLKLLVANLFLKLKIILSHYLFKQALSNILWKIFLYLDKFKFILFIYFWGFIFFLFFWFIFVLFILYIFIFYIDSVYSIRHFVFFVLYIILYYFVCRFLFFNKKHISFNDSKSNIKFLFFLIIFILFTIWLLKFLFIGIEFWYQRQYCYIFLYNSNIDQNLIGVETPFYRWPSFESIESSYKFYYFIIFHLLYLFDSTTVLYKICMFLYQNSFYYNCMIPVKIPILCWSESYPDLINFFSTKSFLVENFNRFWFYPDNLHYLIDKEFLALLEDCLSIIDDQPFDNIDKYALKSGLFNHLEKISTLDEAKSFLSDYKVNISLNFRISFFMFLLLFLLSTFLPY